MKRDTPNLDPDAITRCIETHYSLRIVSLTFLPIGYDLNAFVYEALTDDGTSLFLKIRSGPVNETALRVPRALIDLGIPNIVAPIRTRSSDLWCLLDGIPGYTMVIYPFIRGDNAMKVGMTETQLREFGATLRRVHDSDLAEAFHHEIRVESFGLPSAALVREMQSLVDGISFESPVARRFAAFWREQASRITGTLERAETLGRSLQHRSLGRTLCHADIHAANILVGDDGRIWLIDWDGPVIAPRERDLLFVVGSRIARTVTPEEEKWFFEGYGPTEIDPSALIYYRYERIIEDIGEFGKSVFLDTAMSEEMRADEVRLATGFFAPGGDIDRAERVPRTGWP